LGGKNQVQMRAQLNLNPKCLPEPR
jgi:hypothetical protein